MSLETNRWESLTQDQSAFFSAQVTAANRTVFSPTAHQSGIMPLNATRYSLKLGSDAGYEGVMWPDPYTPQTCCIVMGAPNSRGLGKTAFVRVTARPDSYQIEGVALNLVYSQAGNLYGKQHISRHDTEDPTLIYLGGCFFMVAEAEAQKLEERRLNQTTQPDLKPAVTLTGIEGSVTARLFRSLSSLGSNLVIAGAMNERVAYSDETYDLAETLLKMTVKGMIRDNNSDGLILNLTTRQPYGAVFETGQGLSIIRRVATYPATIGLTTAARPQANNDGTLVTHHYVQAKGATMDIRAFPADAYDPQFLLSTLPEVSDAQIDVSKLPRLGDSSTFALEQRILSLMTERTTLSIEKDS